MPNNINKQVIEKIKSDKDIPTLNEQFKKAQILIIAELLFIILPFIVIGIISFSKGEFSAFFRIPEWSLASSILVGQTIVKLISGLVSKPRKIAWENTALILSIIIVLILVPVLIILSLIMTTDTPSAWLVIAQIIYFFLSATLFYAGGSIGQIFLTGL
ncbi:MAG: hypothetical protein C3F13_02745 [Anaerolineales bacterium]|nr:MAG: hypothetical protein C3F13_02745 [Anaerolineales bacterium]